MRIAVLPTGRMEWLALPSALNRLFPGHHFYSLPTQTEVESNKDIEFPVPSFTSCDVTGLAGRYCAADKLIERAAGAAIGDRGQDPADLVVILDDLEIANLNQPDAVIRIVREAAQRYLGSLAAGIPSKLSENIRSQHQVRHAEALRERVSFHLAKPMIEGWLFGDPQGHRRAGAQRSPQLMAATDHECFVTNDTNYDADLGTQCSRWHALSEQKKRKCCPAWLKPGIHRQIHPKAYLSWLCRDDGERTCSGYVETKGGAAALAALDWKALFQSNSHCGFARAMVHDIAHALNIRPPFAGLCSPQTDVGCAPPNRLLRNI